MISPPVFIDYIKNDLLQQLILSANITVIILIFATKRGYNER